jgi:hypothetical protein
MTFDAILKSSTKNTSFTDERISHLILIRVHNKADLGCWNLLCLLHSHANELAEFIFWQCHSQSRVLSVPTNHKKKKMNKEDTISSTTSRY